MRREYDLPPYDVAYLETTGLSWEAVDEGAQKWLLINEYPIPDGYNVKRAILALRIPPGYPDTEISMAYVFPALSRVDGQPVNQTQVFVAVDGKQFQQWSRHRTGDAPWQPGVDDVANHLVLVDDWLAREFEIR